MPIFLHRHFTACSPVRRALLGLAAASLLSIGGSASAATDAYPNKPIKVIVPFPAGGGGDTLARLMLSRVAQELGQPFVFENLAGAGGNVGSQTGARAAADGYTLIYGTNGTFAINHTLYKNAGFDPLKDFAPISQLSRIAAVVVVRGALPAKTMPELLQLIRNEPGKHTFASAGNGTTSHLAGEILKSTAQLDMVHVPYRGGAPAMNDLLSGQVDMMIEVMPNATPQLKGNRVRGLAVSTASRVASLPDTPTIAESGVPGFDVSAWDAVVVPAGTPAPVVARLNAAVQKALADPELRRQLQERGAEAAPGTSEALSGFIRGELKRWGDAVKRSGAQVD
ncbi:Bug family tripartite tricarboxylate transporter substrate binding protein [Ottowia thiooxydans]|uniref:Bug family tripartite tricarboxylate transporter substrate binding protein n=1 Tax=Ottowia thiooxydans TaxID=219182 RepID=UPI001FE0F950|nr:tripartite tricarboxylate transporter substrate binding protein [Ottowia thiooxydans]